MEEGQTQSAEDTLKQVAGSWDHELASLGKLALAGLYRQSGRDAQAVDVYNDLTAHPTDAVPAGLAQIQLAEPTTPPRARPTRLLRSTLSSRTRTPKA